MKLMILYLKFFLIFFLTNVSLSSEKSEVIFKKNKNTPLLDNVNYLKFTNTNKPVGKSKPYPEYGTSYLATYNSKDLFYITGSGKIFFSNVKDFFSKEQVKFDLIKSNILDFVDYVDLIEERNSFGIKGVLIKNDEIIISLTKFTDNHCLNIRLIKAKINKKDLNFEKLYDPLWCVKKATSSYQVGGSIADFDEDYIIFSIGDLDNLHFYAENKYKKNFGAVLLMNLNNKSLKVLSRGHRNSQGLFYDSEQNIILSTDHGPQGGDEINLLDLNKKFISTPDFGWPISSYGEHYDNHPKEFYEVAPLYKSHKKYGFIEPLKYFVPSIAITSILKCNQKYYFGAMGTYPGEGDMTIYSFNFSNSDKKIKNLNKISVNERVRHLHCFKSMSFGNEMLLGSLTSTGSIIIITDD